MSGFDLEFSEDGKEAKIIEPSIKEVCFHEKPCKFLSVENEIKYCTLKNKCVIYLDIVSIFFHCPDSNPSAKSTKISSSTKKSESATSCTKSEEKKVGSRNKEFKEPDKNREECC